MIGVQRLVLFLLVFATPGAAATRWELQYFYDEDQSRLVVNDLKFPSPRRGVAVGFTSEQDGGRIKPLALVTSDGGAHWSVVATREIGLSLFFLNDSIGWMVTAKGLWRTDESGRSWKKIPESPKGILRVYFLDEHRGWAAGLEKAVYETLDGGASWKKLAAASEPKSNPDFTSYTWIDFSPGRQAGLIVGSSRPPRRYDQGLPEWVDPESATSRREWPSLSLLLESKDGGNSWKPSTTSIFGRITRVRLAGGGRGLALVEYTENFPWPSEVYLLDWKTGKSNSLYRDKRRAVTDVAAPGMGPAYLAGHEVGGTLRHGPIPGKLKILQSDNWKNFQEMEVDYRAVANRAILAAADEKNIWVATDTGMILRLADQK